MYQKVILIGNKKENFKVAAPFLYHKEKLTTKETVWSHKSMGSKADRGGLGTLPRKDKQGTMQIILLPCCDSM